MQCLTGLKSAIIVTFVWTLLKNVSSRNVSARQHLVNTIFEDYDKTTRPIWDTDVTNVTLNPALFSIVGTDEAAESITIVQWLRMIWIDDFLQWNPADYGGTKQLQIPISRIWYPSIYARNMYSLLLIPEDKNYATISYNGTVTISIYQVLKLTCNYNIIMFPFDIQNCTETIACWMCTADQVDIFFKTPTDLNSYIKNSEWDLISMTARRVRQRTGISAMPFAVVYYDIIIQRKPTYYLLTFVLPSFVITTISIIGIFSPFNDAGDREEKVTMGLTTLLTMTVIVTLIAGQMPKTSEGMPLLGIYIMVQIGIAAVTTLLAVLILYQHRKWTTGEPIPAWILTITGLTISDQKVKLPIKNFNTDSDRKDESANVGNFLSNVMKQQFRILMEIKSLVQQAVNHWDDHDDEETLRKNWYRASQRLDLVLMIGFLVLNSVLTAAFLIIGHSHLKI